jgi:hypothetical protein
MGKLERDRSERNAVLYRNQAHLRSRAVAFRSQPARDVIIVGDLPGGTLDPSIDESLPLDP